MSANTTEIETSTLPIPKVYQELLRQTEQNPRYHAEGNVLNHTLLVLKKFHELSGLGLFDESDQEVLYWAALLHDIGKPSVTRWDGSNWRAAGHEKAGIPIARNILMQQQMSSHQRQRILDLVKWHHLPLRLGLKKAPLSAYENVAFRTDIRLLGLFAQMDLQGRICENASQVEELLCHFNEEIVPSIEGLWGTYADIQARFQAQSNGVKNQIWKALQATQNEQIFSLLSVEDMDSEPCSTCYLSIGAPKSGKSEFIHNQHGVYPTYLERSTYTVEGELSRGLIEFLERHLSQGQSVVVDGCHLNVLKRQQIVDHLRRYNTSIQYLYFERSLSEILRGNNRSSMPLSASSIKSAYTQLMRPHPWEAHGIEVV